MLNVSCFCLFRLTFAQIMSRDVDLLGLFFYPDNLVVATCFYSHINNIRHKVYKLASVYDVVCLNVLLTEAFALTSVH